jgi:hypothetical protein
MEWEIWLWVIGSLHFEFYT